MPRPLRIHPREEVLRTMERVYRYRMTTTSGGNISIRESNGDVWITPARVDKGNLLREDIVRVRANGALDGRHPPSSEYPLHAAVYRARPDFGAIIHAHPVALVACSMAHRVPDTRLFHQARHVCGEGGFASYELPGSQALGDTTAKVFAAGHDCVILENHGVIVGAATMNDALSRFEMFEFTAKTIIKAHLLGGEVRYLSDDDLALAATPRGGLPEFDDASLEQSSDEIDRRGELCRFVERGYRQRLFISSQGSFSARLDASSFLITPYRLDRGSPEPEDLALIRRSRVEAGFVPSRAALLHDAIYSRHPNVTAIVNAYPVNATAFSVTRQKLDTHTIPESYVVLRNVGLLPYGVQFHDPQAVAESLSVTQPATLLENDGVLVTGDSILQTFDRLEVLEATAEALVNCRAVGELSRLPEPVIAELEHAFFGPPRID